MIRRIGRIGPGRVARRNNPAASSLRRPASQLPGIDGYEATRRIKAKPALRPIPLIVVTSYALSGDETKALAAGADAYVSKPFSPRALLTKIREYLPS